jgi:hypothetical protein
MNEVSRSKTFITNYDHYQNLKKKIYGVENFWDIYRAEKEKESQLFLTELKPLVREFFQLKGKIERDSLNYPELYGASNSDIRINYP